MTASKNLENTFNRAVQAVITGNKEELMQLFRQHPYLVKERSSAPHKATLLHYIAANGVEDEYQMSPKNAAEIATVLLEAGAEVDATAEMYGGGPHNTTLNNLVSSWWPQQAGVQGEIIKVLVNYGANPNGKLNDGSPIGLALGFGYREAAETLASLNANIDNIIFAAGLGDLERVRSYFDQRGLLTQESLNFICSEATEAGRFSWPPPAGKDPLVIAFIYACINSRLEVVKFLAQKGVDVNCSMSYGQSGLHYAAHLGHTQLVEWLLKNGADPNAREGQFHKSPIEWADEGNEFDAIRVLNQYVAPEDIKQFSHAAPVFPVPDVKLTAEYYRDQLGFEITYMWEDPPTYAVVKRKNVGIHFSKSEDGHQPSKLHTAYYIFVYDIERLYQEYRSKGVEILIDPEPRDYGLMDFDIKDINGYILSFASG